MGDSSELLFFDTFAHDNTEELNLDLVQFPKPVYVTEVRVIPLGARVQADFPGGVRLGATNPSQFQIEFFVNDLGKPGASTFESLGGFEYNQNGCINLNCIPENAVGRKIPTDGLVLRGWYTTITLAVYGTLSNNISEQIVPPIGNPTLPAQNIVVSSQQIISNNKIENDWNSENISNDYTNQSAAPAAYQQNYNHSTGFGGEFNEYYGNLPKDPRNYHLPEGDWGDAAKFRLRDRSHDSSYEKSANFDQENSRDSSDRDRRDSDKSYLHARTRDEYSRDEHDDYSRSERYSRSYAAREDREKRPHTPPILSPKKEPSTEIVEEKNDEIKEDHEEFEPILSDEDILDEEMNEFEYTNNDDLIKLFVPSEIKLRRYESSMADKISESLRTNIGIIEDYFTSSITKYTLKDFPKLNNEIKEEFIHLCEKLPSVFHTQQQFCQIIKLHKTSDKSIEIQINSILIGLQDWLKIALDYEMANLHEKPVYKIRHIKCGIKLIEFCSCSLDFLEIFCNNSKFNVHETLLSLYDQEYMALSIKLMIVKALDQYLMHKFTMEKFLSNFYYSNLVRKLWKTSSVRLKFALNSLLKKINLFEIFQKLHFLVLTQKEMNPPEVKLISFALQQILNLTQNGQFNISQPKRFLPVSAQFEINRSEVGLILLKFYEMFDFLQLMFFLLTNPNTLNLPNVKSPIFDILKDLLKTKEGLEFFCENLQTVEGILKSLLQNEKSYNLGLEIAYKIEAFYYVKSLNEINDLECEIIDLLHGLFNLTFTHSGRICVAQVLGMKDNIKCLFKFLTEKNKKSPLRLAYIIDLIALTLTAAPNLSINVKPILALLEQQSTFDDATALKLSEIKSYLNPLENTTMTCENLSYLVEVLIKNIDNVAMLPGQVITTLRVLQFLGVSPYENTSYVELKYKDVILELFSLDGVNVLTKILLKICEFYKQPALYICVFASNQGFAILNLILPCLSLLKQMLSYVIQCRNNNFKDLTAIPVLLQTYNLLNSFPQSSQQAQAGCKLIVEILLVYTQPFEIHEKDLILNKTLWSLLCGEVLKFTTSAPYAFLSGLLIFSELLPLPFPIQTTEDLSKEEVAWAVNLRKLWAAHLHPHNALIQEMINKFSNSSNSQLLNLLRRVCIQIADLAANSALMIAKSVLETVSKVFENFDAKLGVYNGNLIRNVNFLACLVTHGTFKCALLHLLAKTDDKANILYTFAQVLKVESTNSTHLQVCECILSIMQSFCDIEITVQNDLSNALPGKEQLLFFIELILDYLQTDASFTNFLPAIRTLLLLTEHDYGFFHLREQMIKRNALFAGLLTKLAKSFSKDNADCLSTLSTLLVLIRICSTTEDVENDVFCTPRTMKMSLAEIRNVVGWNGADEGHPLLALEETLKEIKDTFESTLWDGICSVLKLLQSEESIEELQYTEPILPPPETLLNQFSGRLVFSSQETICEERLTIRYWLSIYNDESESENISYNLHEICRQYSSQDFSIVREVEKACRITSSNTSTSCEKENQDNVRKTTSKKQFVAPVVSRGFPRAAIQQRSDLFRSRPPNTSRPPSLHVDDFVALETCGAQPTGPTGYNKFSRELLASSRMARGSRGRAFVSSERFWWSNLTRGSY